MLDHDLIDAEKEAQNQPLIADLTRYLDTQAEDRASLASIRARLLQKTVTTLPVAEPIEGVEEIKLPAPLPLYRAKNARVKPIKRHPYLNALVAACLLVVLVGSFAIVINRRTTSTGTFPPAPAPTVAHDWSILKTFSGTGNKTIDGLDIEVGYKYGWLITCTNASVSAVSVTINANDSGGTNCAEKIPNPLTPQSSSTALSSGGIGLPPLLTIDVRANASTSWKLWLFRGVYYPPLSTLGPEFQLLHSEMDGTGNATLPMDVTLPRAFEVGFECHGSGTFTLYIPTSNVTGYRSPGYRSPCDGQPHMNLADIGASGAGAKVQQIQIVTGAENDWQVVLAGCTNNLPSCGIS